ncbi:uncharacterized protein CCOS01_15536, partial [Colletotrichum costaricense]
FTAYGHYGGVVGVRCGHFPEDRLNPEATLASVPAVCHRRTRQLPAAHNSTNRTSSLDGKCSCHTNSEKKGVEFEVEKVTLTSTRVPMRRMWRKEEEEPKRTGGGGEARDDAGAQ